MKAKLILVAGKADMSVIRLKLPTVVGRARDAGLVIRHPTVSRRHCEIFEVDGAIFVRDIGSLNGTLVDDAPVKEAALKPGHTLTVGPLTFRAVYDYAGSPTLVSPLLPNDQPADSPTVPSAADATSFAPIVTEALERAAAEPAANASATAIDGPLAGSSDTSASTASELEQDLEFEELALPDELARTDTDAPGHGFQVEGAAQQEGESAEEISFEEMATGTTSTGTTSTGGTSHFASDDADSGLDLDLAGDPAEPSLEFAADLVEPAAARVEPAAEGAEEVDFEADELSFDLDGPLPLSPTDLATSSAVAAPEATPAAELDLQAADVLPLAPDDDMELGFDLAEPMPADDLPGDLTEQPSKQQPAQAATPAMDEPDSELSFDLAEPAPSPASSMPASSRPDSEFSLEDDDLTFSLEEMPGPSASNSAASSQAKTDSAHDDADDLAVDDLEFGLAGEPDAAPAQGPAGGAARPAADTADAAARPFADTADELFFDDVEPDPLARVTVDSATEGAIQKGAPQQEPAKKEAAVGNDDADLDSFLKELGI